MSLGMPARDPPRRRRAALLKRLLFELGGRTGLLSGLEKIAAPKIRFHETSQADRAVHSSKSIPIYRILLDFDPKSLASSAPSRSNQRGASADRHETWGGMRWTLPCWAHSCAPMIGMC